MQQLTDVGYECLAAEGDDVVEYLARQRGGLWCAWLGLYRTAKPFVSGGVDQTKSNAVVCVKLDGCFAA